MFLQKALAHSLISKGKREQSSDLGLNVNKYLHDYSFDWHPLHLEHVICTVDVFFCTAGSCVKALLEGGCEKQKIDMDI